MKILFTQIFATCIFCIHRETEDNQFRNKTNSYRSIEKQKPYSNQNKEGESSLDYLPLN